MKYTVEESLRNFKFWDGAVSRAEKCSDDEFDSIEEFLEETAPEDGWTDGGINDMFWFEFPEDVLHEFYSGCAKVVWRNPKDWQIQRLRHYNAGIMRRLWFNGERYEYCAGQDYPGEIRFIQNKINHLN